MADNKHQVHNLIILDESGSMESIRKPTIQSFNEIIQTTRVMEKEYPEQEHRVSLVTFNGAGRNTHIWNEPVKTAREIDEKQYRPDATTPLYDTIGYAVSKLAMELNGTEQHNVLVTIFTDGEENASREWSGAQIKALVEKLQMNRWTFTYIGTDHDVAESADRIAIKNSFSFDKSEAGICASRAQEFSARRRLFDKIRKKEDTSGDYFE
jgi:Mg-chelatase subunit ChlD